jgi:hypothetical protein
MTIKMLSRDDLVDRGIKFHPSALCRLVAQGRFPPPTRLGRRNAWSEQQIDEWLSERMAEANARATDKKARAARKVLAANAAKARAAKKQREASTEEGA